MAIQLTAYRGMDNKTLLLFQKGDKKAFEKLYDQFAPLLFGVILRIVENKKKAEIALSKAFFQIWKSKALYCQQSGCISAWLMRFAREAAFSLNENHPEPIVTERDFDWRQDNKDCSQKLLDMMLISGKTLEEMALLTAMPKDILTAKLNQLFKSAIQKTT